MKRGEVVGKDRGVTAPGSCILCAKHAKEAGCSDWQHSTCHNVGSVRGNSTFLHSRSKMPLDFSTFDISLRMESTSARQGMASGYQRIHSLRFSEF